jgi:hypothetical protein
LIDELKAYNVNRTQQTSDRAMPRTRRAGATNTAASSVNPVLLAELQSIRRGILALIEVGKAISIS